MPPTSGTVAEEPRIAAPAQVAGASTGTGRNVVFVRGSADRAADVRARWQPPDMRSGRLEPSPSRRREAAARAGIAIVDMAGVADADLVIAMVATAEQLDAALVGEGGALRWMKPESICVIMSTVGPVAVQKVADRRSNTVSGYSTLPVTRRSARCRAGDIDAAGVRCSRDAGRCRGSTGVHGIDPPVRQPDRRWAVLQLINQLLCSVHLAAAAADRLTLAEGLGLDPSACSTRSAREAGASWMLSDRGPACSRDDVEILRRWTSSSRIPGWSPTPRATSFPAPLLTRCTATHSGWPPHWAMVAR